MARLRNEGAGLREGVILEGTRDLAVLGVPPSDVDDWPSQSRTRGSRGSLGPRARMRPHRPIIAAV